MTVGLEMRKLLALMVMVCGAASACNAGQRLDLKCTLEKTTSPRHMLTNVDRVIIDTNNPPRVELFNSSTMGNTNSEHWVFAEGNENGDRLIIVEQSGGTIIGSAIRGIAANNFVWVDDELTWSYLAPHEVAVNWFQWKCRR